MAVFVDGKHLNTYLKPELIYELRNHEDTFTALFGKVNKGATNADGVSIQKLINDIKVKTGLSPTETLTPRSLVGKKGLIPWMNFTTDTLTFNKEELRALAFDEKSEGRKLLKEAVLNALLIHSLHAISPDSDGAKTPVIETTGDDDGTGRKKMMPKDLITLMRKTDIKNPVQVLSKNHLLDLQEHAATSNLFKSVMVDDRTMKPIPYAGVKSVSADVDVLYTTAGNKRALGVVPDASDKKASVFIDKTNTMYYINDLFFTMSPMEQDTRNEIPRSEMRIYGTFIASSIEDDRRRAAIIDGRV